MNRVALLLPLLASACVDVSSLAGFACDDAGGCVSTDGGAGECRVKADCLAGFHCGAGRCVDDDECAAGASCGAGALCRNVPGTWECACPTGLFGVTVSGGPTTCSETDPCAPSPCGPHAGCAPGGSAYTCTCDPGYQGAATSGSPATCVDIDECAATDTCGPHATCLNTQGSFKCTCVKGFTGTATTGVPASCQDIDECALGGYACGLHAHCLNAPAGTYSCECDPTYFGTTVQAGAASCTLVDVCKGVSCGPGAACVTASGGYRCACLPGYVGPTVDGGAATCLDVDECANPSACGPQALCANDAGTFACACPPGYLGLGTVGVPTSCQTGAVKLGTGIRDGGTAPLTLALTQAVPVGTRLVAIAASRLATTASTIPTEVRDSRGNTWRVLTASGPSGTSGSVVLWTCVVTTALQPGDTVSASDAVKNTQTVGLWVAALPAHPSVDVAGARVATTSTALPSVSTTLPLVGTDVMLVGSLETRQVADLVLLGAATSELNVRIDGAPFLVATQAHPAHVDAGTLSASSSVLQPYAGVIAAFHGLSSYPPSDLSLVHAPNERGFAVAWDAGRGNGGPGGCSVQYQDRLGAWTPIGPVNCDLGTPRTDLLLSTSPTWYGGGWSSIPIRLVRVDDGVVVGTFPTTLGCAPRTGAPYATLDVDENCDGAWDDSTCSSYRWVSSTLYPAPMAACPGTNIGTPTCYATYAGLTRYAAPTANMPNVSSTTFGAACGGDADAGVLRWDCSACTFN